PARPVESAAVTDTAAPSSDADSQGQRWNQRCDLEFRTGEPLGPCGSRAKRGFRREDSGTTGGPYARRRADLDRCPRPPPAAPIRRRAPGPRSRTRPSRAPPDAPGSRGWLLAPGRHRTPWPSGPETPRALTPAPLTLAAPRRVRRFPPARPRAASVR